MDEKGFIIGMGKTFKRIMSRKAYESGHIRQSVQDGSREFITLIACVGALGKVVPPTLLYKGASGDLQSTWVEDIKPDDKAFFGASANGWSNHAFGLKWLQEVFEPSTQPARLTQWRLLIMDNHSSHINRVFLYWAFDHKILVLILPPHSIHKL
jgi:hypothetical protein